MNYQNKNEYNTNYFVKGYLYSYNENEYDNNYKEAIVRDYDKFTLEVFVDKFNNRFSIIPQK